MTKTYVQINSVANGSTGGIMLAKHRELQCAGVNSFVCWGCGRDADVSHGEFRYGYKGSLTLDRVMTKLDGKAGFHSVIPTLRLLHYLEIKKPDIVHLHNLHGYHLNVSMLFKWLAAHDCEVRWTLHDCWALTGHCTHFTFIECTQWQSHCAYSGECPQLDVYPETKASSKSCSWCFEKKKECFTSIPVNRMTLVTPSRWLQKLVEKSFLSEYPVEVVHNRINSNAFRPQSSGIRHELDVGDRFIVLGVASPWSERKGLSEFVQLSVDLDPSEFVVVLVGLAKDQQMGLPDSLVAIPACSDPFELAKYYAGADVFVHPGIEETFGLTVAEAQACGAEVIVVEDSACAEIADPSSATVISGSYQSLLKAVKDLKEKTQVD